MCHLRSRRRVARRLGHTKVQVPVDLVEGRKDGRIGRTDMKDMKEGRKDGYDGSEGRKDMKDGYEGRI